MNLNATKNLKFKIFQENQTLNLPFMKDKGNKKLGIEHTPSYSSQFVLLSVFSQMFKQ